MDADLAAKLRALAERVSRNVPHRRDAERFHVEKSCICQDLERLADQIEERKEQRGITINRTRRSVAFAPAAPLSLIFLLVDIGGF